MNRVSLVASVALLLGLVQSGVFPAEKVEEVSIWKVEIEPSDPGKYKIKGSVFGIGDPVHETLTKEALVRGGFTRAPAPRSDVGVAQVLRGVFFNDDPCGQLFLEDEFDPLRPSLGAAWYLDFQSAKRISVAAKSSPDFQTLSCEFLGRSHFGDFQFLHAMASSNGRPAGESAQLITAWLILMYRVAIGDADATMPLKKLPESGLLPSAIANKTAMQLLLAKSKDEVRLRALGAMLHTVQDSFAHGHVTRAVNSSEVIQFLCYAGQNEKKHSHDDAWAEGKTDLDKTLAIPGAVDALSASVRIVELVRSTATLKEFRRYVEKQLLPIGGNAIPSGPGDYKS